MSSETSYTQARDKLASLLDRVTRDREVVVIRRRGREGVALVAVDELSSLIATAHLLRSPRNARRLFRAFRRALAGGSRPRAASDLRREMGLDAVRPGRR